MKRFKSTPKTVEKVVEKVVVMENEVVDDGANAYEAYLGKEVLVFGLVYNYSGTLSGVNGNAIALANPYMVFETGAYTSEQFKNAEKLPTDELLIQCSSFESMCVISRKTKQ